MTVRCGTTSRAACTASRSATSRSAPSLGGVVESRLAQPGCVVAHPRHGGRRRARRREPAGLERDPQGVAGQRRPARRGPRTPCPAPGTPRGRPCRRRRPRARRAPRSRRPSGRRPAAGRSVGPSPSGSRAARTRASWARTSRQLSSHRRSSSDRDERASSIAMSRSRRCSFAALRTAAGRPASAPTRSASRDRALLLVGGEGRPPRRTRSGGVPGGGGPAPTPAAAAAAASSGSSAARSPSRALTGRPAADAARAARSRRRRVTWRAVSRACAATRSSTSRCRRCTTASSACCVGPDVVRQQPADRPDQLAVLQQPAGLAPVRGHQVVVLAAQDVDRRAGLGDHLRMARRCAADRCSGSTSDAHQRVRPVPARRGSPGPPRPARPSASCPASTHQVDDDLPARRRPAGCTVAAAPETTAGSSGG